MDPQHPPLSPWLRRPRRRPQADVRLICLPHAGGSASSLRPWQYLLPSGIEALTVQYPGREDRFGDPMVDTMHEVVDAVVNALDPLTDRPYALLGHSMGSAVAYEVAVEARRRSIPAPVRLFASGRPAPHHAHRGDVHLRDDAHLAADLTRLGGTPPEVLADEELRTAVLRYVRNDYRLIETYHPTRAKPLDIPVHVLIGAQDPECSVEAAATWETTTTREVTTEVFPGGHFFLAQQRRRVAATIAQALGQDPGDTAPTWPSTP
ncbi:thioesterase II family protein [Nocardiopsis prasina]|uniref:thioesterase II family protein n=1 Tax=Nocardiopsis prasina TaxID=2015 RepID=UPI0004771A1C|nr:alpha/beta fold hydrolase [Nocardiopsis prasina]